MLAATMAPAPKMDPAARPGAMMPQQQQQQQQHPVRTSSKQPLLKSKYFQPPARSSFSADSASPNDPESPTLSLTARSPEMVNTPNGQSNGFQSPEASPADMGFDNDPTPATPSSIHQATQALLATGRSSASPRTSSESTEPRNSPRKPGHRHSRSGGHIADITMTAMPARKPLRQNSVRSTSEETATLEVPSRKERGDGADDPDRSTPTLRPIAYSPEPGSESARNSRGSWRDNPRSSSRSGDRNAEPEISRQPSEARSDRKSSMMMPAAPPQLPLLFFEQNSIDQMDFAYQDPRPASSRFSASQLNLELKRNDSPIDLGLVDDSDNPARGMDNEDDYDGQEEVATTLELPRHAPLPPLDPSVTLDEEYDEPQTEHISAKRDKREVNAVEGAAAGNLKPIPAKDPDNYSENDKTGEAGSFYWGSPRSSTEDSRKEGEDEEDEIQPRVATDPVEEDGQDSETPRKLPTPDKPTDAAEALVSASALGFGGPSDWEHFGDYDAEEVDDIDLYTSPKTDDPPMTFPNSFNTAVTEIEPDDDEDNGEMADIDEPNNIPQRPFLERKILSTIEERASEHFEDMFNDKNFGDRQSETIDGRAGFDATHPPSAKEGRQSLTGTGDLRARQSAASSSAETLERISFHVPPPPESIASETSSTHSRDEDDAEPGDARRSIDLPSMMDLTLKDADRTPLGDDVKTPRPMDDHDPSANVEARPESDSQGQKTRHASSVLSPTSEDGQEMITISLEFPPQVEQSGEQNGSSQAASVDRSDTRGARRSIYPGSIPMDNPYANLEAWARASLNRYVKVLHDEANASSNEDKYKIFLHFMHNEQRIRAVLYDQDDESDVSDASVREPEPRRTGPTGPSNLALDSKTPGSAGKRISKALPALPSHPEPTPVTSPAGQNFDNPSHSSGPASRHSFDANRAGPVANGNLSDASRGATPTVKDDGSNPDSPATERPVKPLKEKSSGTLRGAPSLNALRKALDIVTTRKSSLTSKDTQAMARASIARASGQPTRAEFGADVKSPNVIVSPAEPASESYEGNNIDEHSSPTADSETNQNEGKPYEGDKAANRQSIYQPYSKMLRQSSVRSGDAGERRPAQMNQSVSGDSVNAEEGKNTPVSQRNQNSAKSPNYRYTILAPLIAVVPQESILRQEPEQLVRLRRGMDAIPDDFSFIHKTVLAWDAEAKQLRERCEQERHALQVQNEQRIDELFNEQEIGYSDISRLEADFKRAEAAKKADEDRKEVETFVSSVFDVVWARINYEMDQLTPLYDECTRLVASASAGRDMFEEDTSGRVPIAPAMEALLVLYQKLMVRHQKAFEAVLERDRRLKKVEVAPWYNSGAIDKVKRIERRFEDAGNKAILEFCRQRDERANLLMDVLDQNTLRGVGANQDYMESVMKAVHTIATELALGTHGDDDMVSTNEVLKAKTITTALARSSEQIVQTFHVADMLLNAADYEVSVANAKLSGADAAAFRRLRDAKAKEDHKLALDLEHRMGLIRSDTLRTQDEVTKLLMLIHDRQGSDAAAAAIAETGMNPEREQRLRKAIEEVASTRGASPMEN